MSELTLDQSLDGAEAGSAYGLTDLQWITVGGATSLYALSRVDMTVSRFSTAADGTLALAETMTLDGGFAVGVEPVLIAGEGALWISGLDTGQRITLGAEGELLAQVPVEAADALVAPVQPGTLSSERLVAGRAGLPGVNLFTDTGTGYTWTASLEDSGDRYLADIAASAGFSLAGASYVAVASSGENGVSLIRVETAGALTHLDALGAADGLPIDAPSDMEVVTRDGETHLVLASSGTSSLSVIGVGAGGSLHFADHVTDTVDTRFQGASDVAVIESGGFVFVAAGGADGGVTLFTLLPGGRLIHLDTRADDATTSLYRISGLTMTVLPGSLAVAGASQWEAGISRLGYDLDGLGLVLVAEPDGAGLTGTAGDDQLAGSDAPETLTGGAGDDILFDGQGGDVLTGGPGADLFVFAADRTPDRVTDYDPAEDRLDLSAFDFLYAASQLDVTPTATGAVISFRAETIVIESASGAPLSAGDFSDDTVLNVDRPTYLPLDGTLTGGLGDDVLTGGVGRDTILGAEGADTIAGEAGDDDIYGGSGDDLIDGGGGADFIDGGPGHDTVSGGDGADYVAGGAGDDILFGDDVDPAFFF